MTIRTCPGCSRRFAGLVEPDCVICGGDGVLQLGAAALHKADPAVVARAIEVYLEATARTISASVPIGTPRQEALAEAMLELRHAGLLADPLAVADGCDTREAPGPRLRRPTALV